MDAYMNENIFFRRGSDTHRGSFSVIQRCVSPLALASGFDHALEGEGKGQVRLGRLCHEEPPPDGTARRKRGACSFPAAAAGHDGVRGFAGMRTLHPRQEWRGTEQRGTGHPRQEWRGTGRKGTGQQGTERHRRNMKLGLRLGGGFGRLPVQGGTPRWTERRTNGIYKRRSNTA